MTPASEVLTGVVAEVIKKAPLTPEKVALAWRLAVGPEVGRATTVTLDGRGVLHVKATSPAWVSALRKSTSLIHIRMKDLLGEDVVKTITY